MARLRTHWIDVALVLAAIETTVEVLVRHDGSAPGTTAAITVPLLAALILPLLARRRFPFLAPVGVWLIGGAASFVDGRLIGFTVVVALVGMGASFLLGNLRDDLQARLGLVIVIFSGAIIVRNDPTHSGGDYLFLPAQFVIFWIAGYALRERSVRQEAAEADARLAVAEERARIARELHDVVGHAVSVMVLQTGAVRHGLPPERADDIAALTRVEQAGRTALTEMRGLVDTMRAEGEDPEMRPQPSLADVDELVGGIRRAGLPVELHVEGTPAELPAALELQAYRIIQEGLTNTLKHAGASRADVCIRYAADALEVEVTDDGKPAAAPATGGGHGLVGIRERVRIYGGEMTAGARATGGFALRTRLPLGEA